MAALWLTCCGGADFGQLTREVNARASGAQLLRFNSVGQLARLAADLPHEVVGAAVSARGIASAEFETAVGDLARSGRAPQILVLVDRVEPGLIARMFYAGATEVIAAEDAVVEDGGKGQVARVEGASQAAVPKAASASDGRGQNGGRRDGAATPRPDPREGNLGKLAGAASADGGGSGGGDVEASASVPPAGPRSDEPARPEVDERASVPLSPPRRRSQPSAAAGSPSAPVIAAISGRGGVGKTTLVTAMACCASRLGLRTAVLDLDLMFGDAYGFLGVDEPRDLMRLDRAGQQDLADEDIEATAMRVAPGLTLWGPIERPECAEMMGVPVERLIAVLRTLSDLILIDTSVFWGDAVAAAVAACDRCLIVGASGPASCPSSSRAADLAGRLGLPRTKMVSVLNRFGAVGCGEEFALRFEMAMSLKNRVRIADGGPEVAELSSCGHMADLALGGGEFARGVRTFTAETLRELGCAVQDHGDAAPREPAAKRRLRLPWGRQGGGGQ